MEPPVFDRRAHDDAVSGGNEEQKIDVSRDFRDD
jgi:hypothetical protein